MADGQGLVVPANPQDQLGQLAAQVGGFQAYPAIMRSQMVADAIRQMQSNPPTLRTAGSLGTNLLANAVLQFARRRDFNNELQAVQSGVQGYAQAGAQGIGGASGDGAPVPSSPQIAPNGAQSQPTPSVSAIANAVSGGAPQPQPAAYVQPQGQPDAALSAPAPSALPPIGRFMSRSGVAFSMAPQVGDRAAGLIDYLTANGYPISTAHGFQPRFVAGTTTPSDHADGLAIDLNAGVNRQGTHGNIPPALAQQAAQMFGARWGGTFHNPDPMHFSWGQNEGGTVPVNEQQAMAAIYAARAGHPAFAPWVQSGGQMPLPASAQPQSGQGAAPPPPPQPQGSPQGGPTMLEQARASQGPTPGEQQIIQQGLQAPPGSALYMNAVQMEYAIRARMAQNPAPPKDTYWGANGQPVSELPVQRIPGAAPGTYGEQDITGHTSYSAVPNAVQNNQVWDQASGSYKPLPGLQPQVSGPFAPGTVVSQTPGGNPSVVQSPLFDPEKARQAFASDPAVTQYGTINRVAQGFSNAIANAAGKNNGVLGTAGVDAVIQSFGLNPRAASAKDLVSAMGLPEAIQSRLLSIVGNGSVTPQGLQQMWQVISAEDQAARDAASRRMQSDTEAGGPAYGKGVPGESALVPSLPGTPNFGSLGPQPRPQAQSGGESPQQLLQDARQAILAGAPRGAVIQRLQTMGVNPAGL